MNIVKYATLLAAISGITFGLEPIFAKLLYANGVNTSTLLVFRYLFASLAIWIIIAVKRLNPLEAKQSFKVIILMGLFMLPFPTSALMYSFNFIPAAVGIICMYCYPIYVTIWSALFFKERITLQKIISLVVAFIGLVLVIGFPEGEIQIKGVIFALLASFVYSIILMINSKVVKNVNPLLINAIYAVCTLIMVTLFAVFTNQLELSFGVKELALFTGLGVLATTVPNLTLLISIKHISVTKASITSMLEPVATAVFAFLILGDSLTGIQVVGMMSVLFGIWLLQQKKLPFQKVKQIPADMVDVQKQDL